MTSERKNQNFSAYCADGKIKLVQRWINDPNINVNWNYHSPLRNAVRTGQIESIKLLLASPRLDTSYHTASRELTGDWRKGDIQLINYIINPITEAFKLPNYEVLDLFKNSGKFVFERTEYLDVLVQIDNPELNEYLMNDPKFTNFVLDVISRDTKYINLYPESTKSLFLF